MQRVHAAIMAYTIILGLALLTAGPLGGDQPAASPHQGKLTALQAKRIEELIDRVNKHVREGRFGQALKLAKEILALR